MVTTLGECHDHADNVTTTQRRALARDPTVSCATLAGAAPSGTNARSCARRAGGSESAALTAEGRILGTPLAAVATLALAIALLAR